MLCALAPVLACAAEPDAQTASQLDIGIGVGAVRFPYYPGAAEDRTLLLPFPYIVYRSRYLDVNHDQVRGKLFSGQRLSLEVDFSGAVAVPSNDVRERQGMPDLDWIGEAGPALRYHVWGNDAGSARLDLVLPLRVAVSAHALTLHHRGYVAAPRLELGYQIGEDEHAFNIESSLSALYGNRDYFQYIYDVMPQYATAERPVYAASGGYGGYTLEVGGSLHRGDMVYGSFISYTDLTGASFTASPLVSRTHEMTFGVMAAWIFKRSSD
ncbi:MAG: MipA/OmpV family protein [Gammaproteobacteria bacterium]